MSCDARACNPSIICSAKCSCWNWSSFTLLATFLSISKAILSPVYCLDVCSPVVDDGTQVAYDYASGEDSEMYLTFCCSNLQIHITQNLLFRRANLYMTIAGILSCTLQIQQHAYLQLLLVITLFIFGILYLLRCTYRAYDNMDEITAAYSVAFSPSGTKLFAGYNKAIRAFDLHRPGRDFEHYPTLSGNKDGLPGIISCISFSPYNGMLAAGSYSQTTAIYAENTMELLYLLHGQLGGVTQVLFSKDGNYLYTGGRKDPYILCWDVRNTVSILYKLYRSSESTNQRIAFDIEPCGAHLGTGGQVLPYSFALFPFPPLSIFCSLHFSEQDGHVHVYDLQTGQWTASFQAASGEYCPFKYSPLKKDLSFLYFSWKAKHHDFFWTDTVNGFCFHPSLPMAATSSGHRRFFIPETDEERIKKRTVLPFGAALGHGEQVVLPILRIQTHRQGKVTWTMFNVSRPIIFYIFLF
ncbi:Telomerase Cajal body protein 1 [Nymphaea thermarum]|nr:Telomerase Cajal body protein 1 [Nymphaea thermarum]